MAAPESARVAMVGAGDAGGSTDVVCAGPTSVPILHLHLLQRCNLACAHCYSDSGPTAGTALTREECLGAVSLADRLGYTHIAISGGEPLLSPHLEAVIACARELGQHVSIVTNGIQAAHPAHVRRLSGAGSVCVSLDGSQATHDVMRGRPGAHASALRALRSLNDAGLHCGASCGVSVRSLDELEAMAAAASGAGARFLNFHAVESAGRASTLGSAQILDQAGQTVLYVAAHVIAEAMEGCTVHCDLVHKQHARDSPRMLYVDSLEGECATDDVASRLGVLVVEPSGRLAPVCYGFDEHLSLGTLRQGIDSGGDSIADALTSVRERLAAVGRTLLDELEADGDWVVFNPSAELARVAAQRSFGSRS